MKAASSTTKAASAFDGAARSSTKADPTSKKTPSIASSVAFGDVGGARPSPKDASGSMNGAPRDREASSSARRVTSLVLGSTRATQAVTSSSQQGASFEPKAAFVEQEGAAIDEHVALVEEGAAFGLPEGAPTTRRADFIGPDTSFAQPRRGARRQEDMPSWSAVAHFTTEVLAAIVAPPRCAACDAFVSLGVAFCAECAASVVVAPPDPGGAGVAAFLYGGAVAESVALFKYHERPDLARPLGDLLWRAVAPRAKDWRGAVLVPVPLHPSRLAQRGYNQSALLARRLARSWGAPVLATALARTRDAPPQATLDRGARLSNLAGAFAVREPRRVLGRAVVLVDDVRTTGATIQACASALLDAGARSVDHAVVARAVAGV